MSAPKWLYDKFHNKYRNEEAVVLYSSGTTGNSKGVILSHYAINTNADAIYKYMDISYPESFAIIKSLCHVSTLVGELLVCLKYHINFILFSSQMMFREIISNIQKFQINTICINPTLMWFLYKYNVQKEDLLSLKTIYTSGAILSQELHMNIKQRYPDKYILNVYGLTEAGPRVTAQTKVSNNIAGSVGKPIDGVEVKIINRNGQNVAANEPGIIIVKTKTKYSGYVVNEGISYNTQDVWIDTKDIGYLTTENELFILGRADNMININSHNVYPETIEEVIMSCGRVQECLICKADDEESLICYYTTDNERELDDSSLLDIKCVCNMVLAPYEIPKKFILKKNLEKTYSGKLIRNYGGIL